MVNKSELAERWPSIFGPDGRVPQSEVEAIEQVAYDMLVTDTGLKVTFAFEDGEVEKAFDAGADLIGRLAPDKVSLSNCTITGGCLIFADLSWEDNDD